ncbi:MAG: hypothetical protein ACE15B_23645 [Bryobacteraceae bacterium]
MYEKLHRLPDEDEEGVTIAGTADEGDTENVQPAAQESDVVIDYRQRIKPEDEY